MTKIWNNFRAYWKSDACAAQLHHSSAHFHFDRRESSLIRVKKKGRKTHKYFISFAFRRLSIIFTPLSPSQAMEIGPKRKGRTANCVHLKNLRFAAASCQWSLCVEIRERKEKNVSREKSYFPIRRRRRCPEEREKHRTECLLWIQFTFRLRRESEEYLNRFRFSSSFGWLIDSVRSSVAAFWCEREKVDGRKDRRFRVLFPRFGARFCLVDC